MNTPRLRRRRGGDSFFKLSFTGIGTSIEYMLFATQLPSWSDGLYFLFGFSCPMITCFLFFLKLLFLGTCYIFFLSVLGLLVTPEIRCFALKSKREKVLDRGQNGF